MRIGSDDELEEMTDELIPIVLFMPDTSSGLERKEDGDEMYRIRKLE